MGHFTGDVSLKRGILTEKWGILAGGEAERCDFGWERCKLNARGAYEWLLFVPRYEVLCEVS